MASKDRSVSVPKARLRKDAQQNRESILKAALAAFANDANASLNGIARAAGVGTGTLYRHFPSRDALLEAVYRKEIERLCDAAPGLHEQHPPDVALARFLDLFIRDMLAKRGMIEAIRAVIVEGDSPINQSLVMIAEAVAPMIEAGRTEGLLREDVTVEDFIRVKGAVATARPENVQRLAVLLIDGLRYGAQARPKPPS